MWGLAVVCAVVSALPAASDYVVSQSVLGSGGGTAAGAGCGALGTVGQTVVGEVTRPGFHHGIGFWYQPGWALTEVPVDAPPLETRLAQNRPNPFNPVTVIAYSVSEPCRVSIRIYDVAGREVAVLADGDAAAGRYEETLDARRLASGVYFARMTAGTYTKTRKLVLLK
jgi:hypothetical protein